MSKSLPTHVDVHDAAELQIFIDEATAERQAETFDPLREVQQDMIDHLTEIRDLLNNKIQLMEMRTKNIY